MQYLLAQVLLNQQKTAYIILNAELEVLEYGGYCAAFFDNSAATPSLLDLLPELIGCEEILQEILHGQETDFCLDKINRHSDDGGLVYLSLSVLTQTADSNSGEQNLLLILNDTTEQTQVEQTLTQQRNELHLLKQSLDSTNEKLEFILNRYVPKEVASALMENRLLPALGGEEREITVMFVDLRNYTRTSENMAPAKVIEMLHVFLDIACRAIVDAGGVVVNYMGDAVMALFNAPDEQTDHAMRAVRAGLEMQGKAQEMANNPEDQRFPPLFFGVGINTGPALVGNLGALHYYQYTAIGDTTNVASRLCSHARAGEVLLGKLSYEQVREHVKGEVLQPMLFKGKSKEIPVFRISALKD